MSIKRIVNTSFWSDSKIVYFSPEDKYFMLYLLTNPHTTQLGIYELNPKQCAFEMGYSEDSARVLLDRFENKYGIIKRSGNEIAIKNFLRHSIVRGGKPVEDCLLKEIAAVKDKRLLSYIKKSLSHYSDVNSTVIKVFNDIENDNDNDNERYVNVSSESCSCGISQKVSAVTDEDFKRVAQVYQDNIHPIAGSIEKEMLEDMLTRHSADKVIEAISEAVKNGVRTIKYIDAILKNWETKGYNSKSKKAEHVKPEIQLAN